MTWPQAAHLSDAMTDIWDGKLVLRILDWDFRQTFRDPMNLFQLNFFHPARYVLAFSENLYGAALFGFPLFAAGVSPVLVYNVLPLAGVFLSGLSAWALARYVTGDPLASAAAGFVYAFVPWRFSQLSHFQFQWGAFLCLLLLFLLRYVDSGRRRELALFGLFFAWNVLTNLHYALFGGLLVGTTLAFEAVSGGPDRSRRVLHAALTAVIASAVCMPWLLPYRRASELYGMRRTPGEMKSYSGRVTDFLSAGDRNRLYGPLTRRWDAPEGFFFPGLLPPVLAGVALGKLRRAGPRASPDAKEISSGATRAAGALDAGILVTGLLWLGALAKPNLRIGPLRLGDAGRPVVILTALAIARLAVAFPKRSRYRNLGDWLRRGRLDRRAVLFVFLGGLGILVALGGHTPYYRFLFQSFGAVFRAVRSPARGIVLFHVALGLLAAWGLSLATRNEPVARRIAWVGAGIVVLGIEYRAFPLKVYPVDPQTPPVYDWLKTADVPGAIVEWPLGLAYDFDYLFRQTAHEKPLVNGYSGFFPRPYEALRAMLESRPIPDSVWEAMAALGAGVVIYHPRPADTALQKLEYPPLIQRGLAAGRIELLGSFPSRGERDFALRLTSAPRFDSQLTAESTGDAVRALEQSVAELAPPFGEIVFPVPVSAGQWIGGWALDDSGVAEVRIASELGPVVSALLRMRMPGLAELYPGYPDKDHGGFGFAIPPLAPGPHTLFVTLVAKDGGETVLRRPVVVR